MNANTLQQSEELEEETLEVSSETERNWKNSLRLSDKELLGVFPEAKEIIPEKIMEWKRARKEVVCLIKKKLALIKSKALVKCQAKHSLTHCAH